MRIATFNLESLDLPPKAAASIEARAAVLRPQLERLDADVLCLQEINGQHVTGTSARALLALDQLLAGTRYAGYHRVSTTASDGRGVADVHNLVTLSSLPIQASHEIRHQFVPPLQHALQTAIPPQSDITSVRFDRPVLAAAIPLPDGRQLTVVNLHLRAPLASNIPGQKVSSFVWQSVGGWAEGYYLSSARRAAQALEVRLFVDSLFAADPASLVCIAGDFNAEDQETPLEIVIGAEENTGNGALAAQSLVVLDRGIAADRRWSVLHHGRPQMLDHILASRALSAHFRTIEVHNEALGDEAVGYAKVSKPLGTYHAGLVAEFAFSG